MPYGEEDEFEEDDNGENIYDKPDGDDSDDHDYTYVPYMYMHDFKHVHACIIIHVIQCMVVFICDMSELLKVHRH